VHLWTRLIGLARKDKQVLSDAMQGFSRSHFHSRRSAMYFYFSCQETFALKRKCTNVGCSVTVPLHAKSVHTPQNRAPWAQNINNRAIPAQQQWDFIFCHNIHHAEEKTDRKSCTGLCFRVIFEPEEQLSNTHTACWFDSLLGKTALVKRTHVSSSRLTAC